MTFAELTQTDGWKKFMAKLYGIGAAVVIVGALFKIQHWPGAGPMLVVGLTTEAIIFIFSSFEPLHEEDDWSLVFPQLAGLSEDDEIVSPATTTASQKPAVSGISKLDELLLQSVDSGEELFERLGQGLEGLTKTTEALADLSNATVATNEYTESAKQAATSLGSIGEGASELSYANSNLVGVYQKLVETMESENTSLAEVNTAYGDQLGTLNKNLSALNAVYELQLENSNKRLDEAEKMYGGLDDIVGKMKSSAEASLQYSEEFAKLGENVASLNSIYGNMIAAMRNA